MGAGSGLLLSAMSRHKMRGDGKSITQNNGGGKMRKWIFVTMLMAVCLMFGGCGSSGKSKLATEDPDDATSTYEEDTSEDDFVEDEYSTEDDEPETEEPRVDPAEAKGIIAMVRRTQKSSSGGHTDVQVISIDPETGHQGIVSEFRLDHVTYAELQRAEEIDNNVEFYYLTPESISNYRVYGNNRDWFSDDFTKMIATRQYPATINETHAGWVDTDGNFFDVSEAAGMVTGTSFSKPNPTAQMARGFHDNIFSFYEFDSSKGGQADNTRKYCVPLDNISSETCYEPSEDDLYDNRELDEYGLPTARIDDNVYIIDSDSTCPGSLIANRETGETRSYLPDAARYNWSGVLSPDGKTVAFLSIPNNGGGNVELFTVPLEGGEPTSVPVVANEDTIVDITAIPNSALAITPGNGDVYYYLLDWK